MKTDRVPATTLTTPKSDVDDDSCLSKSLRRGFTCMNKIDVVEVIAVVVAVVVVENVVLVVAVVDVVVVTVVLATGSVLK